MSATGTAGGRIAPGAGSNLLGVHAHDRNQEATCYVGNLDPQFFFRTADINGEGLPVVRVSGL